ncbi:MAG: hypothetical protein WBP26_01730 [Candidatus Saccharimonadales bacterium]
MTTPTTTRRVSAETLTKYNEYLEAVLDLAELAPEHTYVTTLLERTALSEANDPSKEFPWRTPEGLAAEAAFFGVHAGHASEHVKNLLSESLAGIGSSLPGIDTLHRATLGYTTHIMLQDLENVGGTEYDHLLDMLAEARNTSAFYLGILPQPVE